MELISTLAPAISDLFDTSPPRLAILADFPEERWASMDLVAKRLYEGLLKSHRNQVLPTHVCPPYRPMLLTVPVLNRLAWTHNADRLLNRMVVYPRYLRHRVDEFDVFHLCDHSYSQLVHELPSDCTGVYCHDLDTFRCLLDPQREPRPAWFKAMARRILRGMQKAAVVFHSTDAVRDQIEQHGLIDPDRLVKAPFGVSEVFRPGPVQPCPSEWIRRTLLGGAPYLLHVGSCIPRKRIDVLLEVFAAVHQRAPQLRLMQVGGTFTDEQRRQIERLRIGQAVVQRRGLHDAVLAGLMRGARMVLLPTEAEGFCLPIIEALACGTCVVVSDLPVLREVADDAAVYCPVGNVGAWRDTIVALLNRRKSVPPKVRRVEVAARYSWARHCRVIAQKYAHLSPVAMLASRAQAYGAMA